MRRRGTGRGSLSGAAAFAGPLAVYIATLSPGVDFWDTGEMQTVPYVLGIAHPTGFPLFVLGGFAFSHLVPFGSPAWRLSLLSALASAGAAWLLYAFVRDLTRDDVVSVAAAWAFSLGDIVWTRAVRAEVHDVALFFTAAALVAGARAGATRSPRRLTVAALACGCGIATHPVVALSLPAVIALAWPALVAASTKARLLVAAAFALPLGLYAYLPLRSGYVEARGLDPAAALGLRGGAFFDYGAPSTPSAFWSYVTGAAFQPGAAFSSIATRAGFIRALEVSHDVLTREYGIVMLVLALVGFGYLAVRRRRTALGMALLFVCAIAFAPNYGPEADPWRYALPALFGLSACAACGAFWVMRAIVGDRPRYASLLGASMLLVALWPNAANAGRNVRRIAPLADAREFIDAVKLRTADGSLIVATWTFASPLAYEAYVEQRFGSRRLVSGWPYEFASRYPAWRARFKHVYFVVPIDAPSPLGRPLYAQRRWQLAELK